MKTQKNIIQAKVSFLCHVRRIVFSNNTIKNILLLVIVLFATACQQNKPDASTEIVNDTTLKSDYRQDTLIFNDPQLAALVKETEVLFSIFDTISSFGEYNLYQLKLDKQLINEIAEQGVDTISQNNITAAGFIVTSTLSGTISSNIEKILGWKNINNYDLSLLLKNYLTIAKSPDGKLYSFSFDEKTGGTYQSQISIIHYSVDSSFSYEDDVFNQDGYYSIDTIHTAQGVKYLLLGSAVGCMTCVGHYIDLVHYEKGRFVKDFSYSVSSRSNNVNISNGDYDDDRPVINYDSKQRIITISYYTNDMTPSCNCGEYGSSDMYDEEESKGRSIECIYAFDGNTFKLVKK